MESLTLSNQSKNTRSCSQQTPRTMPPPSSAVSPETSAKNDVVTDGPGPPSTNKNEEGTPTPTPPTTSIPSIAAPRSREVCVAASSSSSSSNTTDPRSSPSPPAPSSISRPKIPRAAKTKTRKTAPINARSNPLTGGVVVSGGIAAENNKGHQCRRSRARSTSNNNSNSNTRSNSDKKTTKNSKPKSKTATQHHNGEPPQDQQQQLQDQPDQQPVPGGAHNHQVVKTELRGVRTAAVVAAAEWCAADSSASSSSCSYSSSFFGDIVCGFSGGLPRHGYLPNFKFRRLLQYLRDVYDDLPSSGGNVAAAAAAANGNTSGKKLVCTMILEFIWEHGGRFLRHNIASDCWEPLSYSKCFAKVSQTFRDLRSCRFDHNSSAGRNNRSSRSKSRKRNSRGGAQQQPPTPHNGAGAGAASMCTLTRGDIVEWELLRAQIRKRLRLPRECADVVARRTLQILATATMTTTLAGAPPPPPPPSAPSTSAAAAAATQHRPPQRPFFPVLPAQQNLPLLAQMADQQTATRAVAPSFRSGPLLTPGSPTSSRTTRPAIRSSSREELVTLRHNSSLDTTAAAGSTAFAATPSSVLALCRPPSCRHEPPPSQRVGPRRVSLELGSSSSSPSHDQHAVEEDDSIVYETSSSRQTTDSASSRLKATSPPQQNLDGAGNDTDHTDKEESSSSSSTQKTTSNITEVVFQDEEEEERLPGTLYASYCTTPPRNSNRRNKINNTTFEQQRSPSVAHILGLSPVIGVVVPPPRPAVAAAPFMMSPPPQQQVATRHHHHHQEVVLLVTPHVHQPHNDDSSGGEDDPLLFLGMNDDPDPMRYLPEQKTIFGAGDGDPFFLLPHVPSSQHSYPYADPRSNIAGHSIQSSTNILDAAAPLREIFDLPIISMDEDDADDDYHQRLQDMYFLSSESTGDILMDDQPHQPFSSSLSVPSSFHSTNSNTYVAMEEDLHVSSVAAQSHTAITDSQKEETTSFVVPYAPRVGTIVAI